MLLSQLGLVALFGAIIGSFLGAWTYRLPREISIARGRSFCPSCKHQLSWLDNIPLLSFILLGGKCRYCRKPISRRYVVIEFFTVVTFVLLFFFYPTLLTQVSWLTNLGVIAFPLLFGIAGLLIAIFVIDFEYQIIPDELNFLLLLLVSAALIFSGTTEFWVHLLAGFSASLFLLLLNFVTQGRGMGLGDVKFSVPIGMFFGLPLSIVWTFSAFFIGAIIGVFLLLSKSAHLKSRLAFGPFLVIAFFTTLLFGKTLLPFVLPLF